MIETELLDFLNFVIALQEKLGVDIPEADYPQLQTLDGAITYLRAKSAPASSTWIFHSYPPCDILTHM